MIAPIHPVVSQLKALLGVELGCYDIHRLLFNYAEGTLRPDLQAQMDAHLKDCRPCLEYLKTYRQTIAVTHDCCQPATDMPSELREKLQEFIARL
jgi:hypothetical protein